jgi:hypothetical protein
MYAPPGETWASRCLPLLGLAPYPLLCEPRRATRPTHRPIQTMAAAMGRLQAAEAMANA